MRKTGLLTWMLILGIHFSSFAQKEDGKITVEITKEVDGEKRSFKGEYNSTEEMKADPAYREFAGENQDFEFWFDDDEQKRVLMHLDRLKGFNGSAFRVFTDSDSIEDNTFILRHLDQEGVDSLFTFDFQWIDSEAYEEQMKDLGIEIEEVLKKFDEDDFIRKITVIDRKKVRVADEADEFGKRGKVSDNKKLELNDLAFFPNPSPNGKLQVRFSLSEPAELSITVSDLEGKNVFSRYFDQFSGTFSESIDLSAQEEGIYLLEIASDKKRLTKKIVID